MEKRLNQKPRKMLTIKELADYLCLSERTVYRLIGERAIPALKIRGQWRFEQKALDKWVAGEISHHTKNRRKTLALVDGEKR